jgi:signal transduction histidine kinase
MSITKTSALLLIGLLILNCLRAQTSVADSLKHQLNTHLQADTLRVDLLNELAREYRRSKPKDADSLIDIATGLADQLNYAKGKGNALAVKAARYYDASNFPASTKTFEEAKQLLESANDIKGLAFMLRTNAGLLMDEGNYALSLDNYLQALKLAEEAGDTKQVIDINGRVGYLYNIIGDYEKAIPYQAEALKQAERIQHKPGISLAYNAIGKTYKTQGKYSASLDAYTKGLRIHEELKDSGNIHIAYSNIGDVYERMGRYQEAFYYLRSSLNYLHRNKDNARNTMIPFNEWIIGRALTHSGRADSGLFYAKHAYERSLKLGWRLYLKEITFLIAESAAKLEKWETAYQYLELSSAYKDSLTGQEIARKTTMLQAGFELDKKQAQIALLTKDKELQAAERRKEHFFLVMVLGGLASVIILAVILFRNNRHKQRANLLLQKQKQEIDKKAYELSVQKDELQQSYSNVESLSEIGRKITSSLSVETIISTVYDNVNSLMDASVFGIGIYHDDTKQIDFPATYENGVALPAYTNSIYDENRFAGLCFISGKEIVMGDLQAEYKNFLQTIPVPKQGRQPVSLIYLPLKVKDKMLGVITVQSFNKNAFTDYHLYMLRTIAIYAAIALENAESYKKLNQTVDSLKKTQTQLIQSEKMASLGELTAGIAHEIQNPLNFVNNFSEVNTELIDELEQGIEKRNLTEIKTLAKDIKENEQKINHHGKRADAIVKGMLQHSRTSSGQKEMIEINELADEYLRLAYHGLRAKDKSFNTKFETDFDKNIGKINIIPQDMGRVLVNLINNAFYTVGEKKKMSSNGFEPTVKVITKKMDGKVEIKVKDNGAGISQKVLDKIFQPFFTTKPTGQGTGLGLSLAYDIVKAHGGELKVETKEGEGSEFIIHLPTN